MTTTEFSNEFDILWDNLRYNASSYPSLNEYEKSVFLTQSQEEILKNYFNPKGNKYQEGFDDSIKRLTDFSEVVKTTQGTEVLGSVSIDPRSRVFEIDDDVFFLLNESVRITKEGNTYNSIIQNINYNEYTLLATKPYFQPPKRTTWKLVKESSSDNFTVELIPHSKYDSANISYIIRYVKKPVPIILESLTGVTIDGLSTISECELNPIIHREILLRAVTLAENSIKGNLNSDIQLEQRSE